MKPIPPLPRAAFLLDLDGTLIDIAPTPASVVVPQSLPPSLAALRSKCGDAVAVVSGRPIAEIDALLGGAPFAVAAEHGAVVRHAPGLKLVSPTLPTVPEAWLQSARSLAERHEGAAVERKTHGFVLHYRAVPDRAEVFHLALQTLMAGSQDFALLPAKMAWEVRPAAVNKGLAVEALMASSPFAGRVPVFVGDDVTDDDGIAAAERLGGVGLKVGKDLPSAQAVRDWIAGLAA